MLEYILWVTGLSILWWLTTTFLSGINTRSYSEAVDEAKRELDLGE